MGVLDHLQERGGAGAKASAHRKGPSLCVVTCDDSALTARLETCLGLGPGEAAVIRLPAGNPHLEIVERAVAKAILVERCEEVLVLTHSTCTLYELSANTLAERLAELGIPRAAVPHDLRELVGAGRDPREVARETAQRLRACPFLPASVPIHIGYLDEASGLLQVVERGEGLTAPRPTLDGPTQVAGYQPGPTQVESSQLPSPGPTNVPLTALPPPLDLSGMVPLPSLTVSLQALQANALPLPTSTSFPDVALSLPSLTTQLPEVSVALPSTARLPTLTVALPSLDTPPLPSGPLPETTPIQVAMPQVTVSLEAGARAQPPPPPRPGAKPPGPTGKKSAPRSPTAAATPAAAEPSLSPELIAALEKVRAFMASHVGRGERRRVYVAVVEAARANRPSEELVKLAVQPVLATGDARYRVLDELLVLKDELARHPSSRIIDLLRPLFR